MLRESVRRPVPKFVTDGYALYRNGEYLISRVDGKEIIVGRKTGLDYIGIRPDAPREAKAEYAAVMKEREALVIAAYREGNSVKDIAECYDMLEDQVEKIIEDCLSQ